MILYIDILQRLAKSGWTSYKLVKDHLLSPSTIDRIRKGQPINTTTVDTVCKLCHCQPGDLMTYVPDSKPGE